MLDLVDDLVTQGLTPTAAQQQALQQFGDINTISQAVIKIHHPRFNWYWSPQTILLLLFILSGGVIFTSTLFITTPLIHDVLLIVKLWWYYLAIIIAGQLLNYRLIQYFSLRRITSFITLILTNLVASASLTIVLDIDDFETNLDALILAIVLTGLIGYFWKHISMRWRAVTLYIFSIISTLSILLNKPLWQGLYQARCFYITPDNIPLTGTLTSCTQVTWFSPLMLLILLCLVGGWLLVIYKLKNYWLNRGTKIWQRSFVAMFFLGTIIIPIKIHDINNQAELDIIPWKYRIDKVYLNILGRLPENKDVDFYATTRSFEHMSKVQDTLYKSNERRLKINQLYQQFLQRNATKAEIDNYVNNKKTIPVIINELTQ